MRESNFHFPSTNKACVSITSALYDRRALDCTADLPLVNSLSHLNYLTSSSARIREILTTDGGLERLVRILRTTRVTEDTLHNWKWTMAFQCVVNVGVRGTAEIRQRVVQVGAVPILVEILHAYLLGTEVVRLEQKVNEAMNALSQRMNVPKVLDYSALGDASAVEDHAEINDPSTTVVSSHMLASGANNSTGAAPARSSSAAAARSNAQAAVAAVTGVNPIPVSMHPLHPPTAAASATVATAAANRQQTRRVGEGIHPLSRHISYSDVVTSGISGSQVPYSSHAYLYSEQERLQAEYDAVRRRLQAINHVMYRHDDVVLTLQLLAYLTKTPSQRQLFHECPLLSAQMRTVPDPVDADASRSGFGANKASGNNAGSMGTGGSGSVASGYATAIDLEEAVLAAQFSAQANAAADIPAPRRRKYANDATVDVFSIVERFTVQKTFPSDMVYWSSIVMRNSCRREETRNNCRQCAYLKCQKWESHPNEFAKCRRCRKAKYCSKYCQSKAWQEGHRNWCTERNHSGVINPGVIEDTSELSQNTAVPAAMGQTVAPTPLPPQQPQVDHHIRQEPQPQPQPQLQQHQHQQHHQQQHQQQYQQQQHQQYQQQQHQQQQQQYHHQQQQFNHQQYQNQQQHYPPQQSHAGYASMMTMNPPAAAAGAYSSTESQGHMASSAMHESSILPQSTSAVTPGSGGTVQPTHAHAAFAGNDYRPAAGGPMTTHHNHGNSHHHHPYRPPQGSSESGQHAVASRSRAHGRGGNQ
ncbi:hypothetical protein GGI15_001893 [Coemansia interrupta]|uniref:MYND-type domain-containing protein n=1 Tax=Coemansia interrupta TaxID=1126814 RepID=A0A9W8HI47_9FUNG|nr:hypothetical protein GGI15_001893 [Coemansia interrupta]